MLHSIPTGELYGSVSSRNEQIEVAINGERVALLDINYRMDEKDPNGMNITSPRIHVKAGPQHVTAAFIQRFEGPVDDLVAPIDYTLADTRDRRLAGHHDAAAPARLQHHRAVRGHGRLGHAEPSQDLRVPAAVAPAEEIPCARKIVTRACGPGLPAHALGRRRRSR